MKLKAVGLIFGVLLVAMLTTALVFAETVNIDETGTIDETQITTARIFRDCNPSDCSGKVFPGTFGGGASFGYTIEGEYGPVEVDSCVTVTWDPDNASAPACSTNGHPVAFLNGFDPSWGPDNEANYLGDAGSSEPNTWSFPVSAGDTFVIVFMNTSSPATCNYDFAFSYEREPEVTPEPTAEVTPEPAPPVAPAGCQLPISEGSVVGEAPLGAQVYYEPGNVSPGIVLNPGTYVVLGQDSTETYYKILLACQYVWVLKDTMQPSYLPPQNGAPLPGNIVEVDPAAPASSANDVGA